MSYTPLTVIFATRLKLCSSLVSHWLYCTGSSVLEVAWESHHGTILGSKLKLCENYHYFRYDSNDFGDSPFCTCHEIRTHFCYRISWHVQNGGLVQSLFFKKSQPNVSESICIMRSNTCCEVGLWGFEIVCHADWGYREHIPQRFMST